MSDHDDGSSRPSRATRSPEAHVRERYSAASQQREQTLCCPTSYRPELLQIIPAEILERDYGCGDPSPYVRPGDTVLDLGAGGGKLCYIAAQLVGPTGRVIGVDCNQDMLSLARQHQPTVAQQLGYDNVEFLCGMIQDLRLDLELLEAKLAECPEVGVPRLLKQRELEEHLRQEQPMIHDASVDCVVSNCVLNLVRPEDRHALFRELYRVVKVGGRVAISDIVSDEDVPESLQRDGSLWSGCISGAWREDRFLAEFEQTGFHGIQISNRQTEPWQTVDGYEFRSITVTAWKGKEGPCLERNQAVIYRGPFRRVQDDDGHSFQRGQRTAVCDKTYRLLQQEPYTEQFIPLPPYHEVSLLEAQPFDSGRSRLRDPRETKGADYDVTAAGPNDCCGPDGSCC